MADSKPSPNGASSFCTAVNCIDGRGVQLPVNQYLTRRFDVEFVDIVSDTGPVGVLAHDPECLDFRRSTFDWTLVSRP